MFYMKINFDECFIGREFNNCFIYDDGTEVPIQEQSPFNPHWYSYMKLDSALQRKNSMG